MNFSTLHQHNPMKKLYLLNLLLLTFVACFSQDSETLEGSPMIFGFTYGSTLEEMKAHAETMRAEGKDITYQPIYMSNGTALYHGFSWDESPERYSFPSFTYNTNGCRYELECFFKNGKLRQIIVDDIYDQTCEKLMQDYVDKHYPNNAPGKVNTFYRYEDFLNANKGLELHPPRINEIGITVTEGLGNTYRFCSLEHLESVLEGKANKAKSDQDRIDKGLD